MGDEDEINLAVQRDWEQREFIEMLTLNMSKIVVVLNQFDASTRERLSKISDRIGSLERTVEYLDKQLSPDDSRNQNQV